jgi:2,4-dienoyl-CoA reductase-like NADH-dependent reductase (Old Yellow Enzyme family)
MPSAFEPARLGALSLANRLVVAPMTTYSSQPDGNVADDEPPFLRRRAEGGFGLVMTAACCVHPSGHAFDGQWHCSDDRFIPSLRAMADAIHEGGSLACLQIHHGGRACPGRLCRGQAVSASAIPSERPNAETPRALEHEEILELIDAFGQAARRAVEAGYDAIEIHGANTYLLQQFVSPHSNRREDEWGQDRLLFPRMVTEAVLKAVDGRAVVGYRFSPEEMEEPGIRWEHTEALIEMLCAQPIDFLHASLWDFRMKGIKGDWPDTTLERIVQTTRGRLPVMAAGLIRQASDAEEAMALGADFLAIGRAALSQPDWPKVAIAGGEARIKIPATGAGELLTWPKGLEEKAYTVANWFEIEED